MRDALKTWMTAPLGFAAVLSLALSLPSGVAAAPGERDPAFGNAGIVRRPGVQQIVRSAVLQADGRIVVGGGEFVGTNAWTLTRYATDGSVDTSFGTGGNATTTFPGGSQLMYAVAEQPDGKLLAAGTAGAAFALARYDADGQLDAGFGSGGLVTTAFPGGSARAVALAVQPDGRIIAAGRDSTGFALARYNGDGSLDTTFGTGGLVTPSSPDLTIVTGLALQPDGRILAGGQRGFTVVRYMADGSVDTSFGSGGIATAVTPPGAFAYGLLRQPDGKIVQVGQVGSGGNDFGVARYETDGTLDGTFGLGGVVETDFDGDWDEGSAVVLQPDGALVVAGRAIVNQPNSSINQLAVYGLARYGTDGTLDASFGVGGLVRTVFPEGRSSVTSSDAGPSMAAAAALLRQPDGMLIAVGRLGLVRYFGGACGNGTLEGGEECDDGNTTPGDGCDASCCVADTDGDGQCDSWDACIGGVPASKPKVIVEKLNTIFVLDDRLTVKGEATLPHPFVPAIDPVANGIRVRLDGAQRNLLDVFIPGGAFSSGVGWKVATTTAGTKWTYVNKTETRPAGFTSAVIEDRSNHTPGLVRFRAKAKDREFRGLGADLPLTSTVVLSPATGTTVCGVGTFPGPLHTAPACTFNLSGTKLNCK